MNGIPEENDKKSGKVEVDDICIIISVSACVGRLEGYQLVL